MAQTESNKTTEQTQGQSPAPAQPIKEATPGRTVDYFPSQEELDSRSGAAANGADVVPAIVSRNFGWTENNKALNLRVLPDSDDILWRPSVQHKSLAAEGAACWDWPVIK